MNFYLTNDHRKYMGLKPLEDHYETMIFKGKYNDEIYLFFEGKTIKNIQ